MTIAYFKRLRLRNRIRRVTLAVALLLPTAAIGHGDDFSWPAQFTNSTGTPCCTLNRGMGDCLLVPKELAMGLSLGSVITLDFPSGLRTITINAIHIGEAPAICAPGCLFTEAGV